MLEHDTTNKDDVFSSAWNNLVTLVNGKLKSRFAKKLTFVSVAQLEHFFTL